MASEFEKIVQKNGTTRRGRPAYLTADQKRHRKHVQAIKNRKRNEARRRAYIVLQNRYEGEFNTLMANELAHLNNDPKYIEPTEAEFLGSNSVI